MPKTIQALLSVLILSLIVVFAPGCGTTSAQQGGSGGVALGAIAGGLIGGSWKGAAIGAAVGGGLGYIAGNERDKAEAEQQASRDRAALQTTYVSSNPQTAYRPPAQYSLVGTTWRVVSLVTSQQVPKYHSIVATFQTNTKMTTLTITPEGVTQSSVETYRIIDDVIIISGTRRTNGEQYVINAKWSLADRQLILVGADIRIVLEQV